jgi:antitoxin FitA
MRTVTIKNVPDDLYDSLKRSASANHRSINSEVIVCMERALGGRAVDTEAVLARARELRKLTRKYPITDAELAKAKAAGRP